ncbi:MAG: flavodoxin family protein [Clostridia bacterium]|nr:flavodoxin family protein [Clostridia bacterium]
MSKNVLIIKGSARVGGYSNSLCDEIHNVFKDDNVTVYDAYKENPLPCTGCNYCEGAGRCVNRDLDSFFEKLEAADIVVFSSPVYNGTFTSPVKVLLDRFQPYYTGFYANGKVQQIKKRRRAYLVVTAGRDGERPFQYMQWQLSCACSILNLELVQSFLCPFTDTEPDYDRALSEVTRSLHNEKTQQ